MSLQIHRSIKEWQVARSGLAGRRIGFVPTMGALHDGHKSLLERSLQENEVSVLSIYVNPTQFNDPKDLMNYPKTLDADIAMAEASGVDHLILPQCEELYADQYRFRVSESEFSKTLCGANRPGHFDGVLTVVMKLLNIVNPTKAYFGEKDFQQLQLIKDMAATFFMPVEIVPCPIVRENDGLAMSSRNVKLDATGREKAAIFARILKKASTLQEARAALEENSVTIDYIEEHQGRRFGAVRIPSPLGEVRLIDNVDC